MGDDKSDRGRKDVVRSMSRILGLLAAGSALSGRTPADILKEAMEAAARKEGEADAAGTVRAAALAESARRAQAQADARRETKATAWVVATKVLLGSIPSWHVALSEPLEYAAQFKVSQSVDADGVTRRAIDVVDTVTTSFVIVAIKSWCEEHQCPEAIVAAADENGHATDRELILTATHASLEGVLGVLGYQLVVWVRGDSPGVCN